MNQPTLAAFESSLRERPLHQLIETDTSDFTDEQKRIFVSVLQQNRQSPQTARSATKKQAAKLAGTSKEIDITSLL